MSVIRLILFLLCLARWGHAEIEDLGDTLPAECIGEPLFVSLGSHCEPAHMLRACGLRKVAFPFDWIVSFDGEALIELLEEDFANFFYLPSFVPYGPAGHLLHTYYHLEFLHEGDFGGDQFLFNMEKLQAKYERRIARFRSLSIYPGRVFFIREAYEGSMSDPHRYFRSKENLEISEAYALRLFNALQERFPLLDFSLLIINHAAQDIVTIEREVSPRLLMVRANPSSPEKVAAYTVFFREVSAR